MGNLPVQIQLHLSVIVEDEWTVGKEPLLGLLGGDLAENSDRYPYRKNRRPGAGIELISSHWATRNIAACSMLCRQLRGLSTMDLANRGTRSYL